MLVSHSAFATICRVSILTSQLVYYVLRTENFTACLFYGDPMGGGGVSKNRQYFATTLCPDPVHVWVTRDGRLNCFQPSKSKGDIMSPTFSPY